MFRKDTAVKRLEKQVKVTLAIGINWADVYTLGEIKGWKNLTVCLKAFTAASGAIDSTSPSPDGGTNGANNAIILDTALSNSNSDTDYISDNSISASAKSKVNEVPMKNSGLPLTAIVFAYSFYSWVQ